MSDIIKVAEQLNAEVSKLNNERSKLEGMLESAKSNYESAVKEYAEKYGVVLTEDKLQEEYNKVYAEVKGSMIDLKEQIESIKRGDYKANEEKVDYDYEPDVEPVRKPKEEPVVEEAEVQEVVINTPDIAEVKTEEVKAEPKKRGRKPKAKAEEVVAEAPVETPVSPIVAEPEVTLEEPAEKEVSIDLGFSWGENLEVSTPTPEPVAEPKKERRPISTADLASAIDASANQPAPISFGGVEEDFDSTINLGVKPAPAPEVPKVAPQPVPKVEVPKAEEPISFGNLGFDGKEVEDPMKNKPIDLAETDFGRFGDFGSFAELDAQAKEIPSVPDISIPSVEVPKAEEKPKAQADVWGSNVDLTSFNLDDFVGNGSLKL